MPGSNFDPELHVVNNHITAQGPLDLPATDRSIEIYVWVVQNNNDGTSAICTAHKHYDSPPANGRWIADTKTGEFGNFVDGAALGTAMTVSKRGNNFVTFRWSRAIRILKP